MLHPFKIHGKFRSIPWSLVHYLYFFMGSGPFRPRFRFEWVHASFPGGVCGEEVSRNGSGRVDLLAAPLYSPGTHLSRKERERERRARSTKSTCVNICKVDDRSRSVHRAQSCEAVKKGKLPFDDFNDCRWQFTSTAVFRSFWNRLPPSQNHFDLYSKL